MPNKNDVYNNIIGNFNLNTFDINLETFSPSDMCILKYSIDASKNSQKKLL